MANKGMENCNRPLDYEVERVTRNSLIKEAKIIISADCTKNNKAISCLQEIVKHLEHCNRELY